MLKFLLIIAITIYLLSKLGRLVFGMGMSSQNRYHQSPDSSVNVNGTSKKNKSTIKGGEYIDFEEVK